MADLSFKKYTVAGLKAELNNGQCKGSDGVYVHFGELETNVDMLIFKNYKVTYLRTKLKNKHMDDEIVYALLGEIAVAILPKNPKVNSSVNKYRSDVMSHSYNQKLYSNKKPPKDFSRPVKTVMRGSYVTEKHIMTDTSRKLMKSEGGVAILDGDKMRLIDDKRIHQEIKERRRAKALERTQHRRDYRKDKKVYI